MKSTKITLRLLATILLLMFICNCFAVIGYASEFETETTAEEETTDVVELENSEGNFIVDEFSSNSESESYPSGFSKANISNGVYYIQNIGTSRYVDIHGPNTDMIHQWRYHAGLQENWEITKQDDGYYTIKSLYKDKYIGIENTNVGVANINLYSTISDQTKWVILKNSSGQHTFVPKNNISLMLYAPNSSVGTELQLTNTNVSNNYNKWTLIMQIQNTNTNLVQNIETRRFASPYGPNTDDGTRIHQWDFSTSSARRWIFERQSDYFYTIKDKYTQKYMGIAEDEDGTIYIEQFSSIEDCTKWKMYKSSSGNAVLTPLGYEPFSSAISVDPSYNDVGSILKLVAYTNDANFKDEWQLITDRTYLGALTTTWHSDASSVGYWDLDGTSKSINVYVEKLNISETLFYFFSGTNEAIDQWENLLNISFSQVYDESSANIKVYGGTRDQIEDHGKYTGTTWTGLSSTSFYIDGMMNVNGGNEIITINRIIRSRIDIISRTDTDAVRKCIAHEFGHSLGYAGHAPNSTDVMYAYSHGYYTLKTLESNHIKVIYDLYNK